MNKEAKIFIINGVSSFKFNKLEKYIDKLYKKNRINKYVFEKDKAQAVLSELLIRVLYCEQNNVSNSDVIFKFNEFGKPFIENYKNFCFNISHSNDVIVAIIDNEDIGIDVELIQNLSDDLAKFFCTENEYNQILKEEKNNKGKLITFIWSLKEAYLKFLGTGMSKSFKSFDVISRENIDSNIFLYNKQYKEYSLSVCSKKELQLNNIIEEIDIEELLIRYELVC